MFVDLSKMKKITLDEYLAITETIMADGGKKIKHYYKKLDGLGTFDKEKLSEFEDMLFGNDSTEHELLGHFGMSIAAYMETGLTLITVKEKPDEWEFYKLPNGGVAVYPKKEIEEHETMIKESKKKAKNIPGFI